MDIINFKIRYIINSKSITESPVSDKKIKSVFISLNLIFEYPKNNKYGKYMANSYLYQFLLSKNNKTIGRNNKLWLWFLAWDYKKIFKLGIYFN